ncbi:MAG: GNAT family N-acetyltransferase [Parvibaculaceae bacterium]
MPPPSFVVETENFVLRPMLRDDASPALESWMEDETLVEMINATQRRWTVAEQAAYIARFDGQRTRWLIGLFPRGQAEPIGLFEVKLRPDDGLMLLTHVLGNKDWRGTGASREASIALFDYFFNKLSYAKAKANVRPGNKAMQWLLLNGGWRMEARLRKHLRIKATGERSDVLHFGIMADEWRAKRESARTVPKHGRLAPQAPDRP